MVSCWYLNILELYFSSKEVVPAQSSLTSHQINSNTDNISLEEEKMDGKNANNNHSVNTNEVHSCLKTMKDPRSVGINLVLL